MIYSIDLCGKEVTYNWERKNVKNINLRIKPDCSIHISANPTVSHKKIESFLSEKTEFVLKALDHYCELQNYAPKPKKYVDGEHFRICGHDLRLKVLQGAKNFVESDGVYLKLTVKDTTDIVLKQKTMDKWMNQ